MYGKVAGASNAIAGIALLPETGNNRPLFIAAASLLVLGVAIFVAATVVTRKNRAQVEAE